MEYFLDYLPSEFVDNFNEININFNEFIIIALITGLIRVTQ